jgi:hypothetical protein
MFSSCPRRAVLSAEVAIRLRPFPLFGRGGCLWPRYGVARNRLQKSEPSAGFGFLLLKYAHEH